MKINIIPKLLLFVLFASTSVYAQTVDEVIASHIKAHGGQENWDKVESLKLTGAFTGFSTQRSFTTIQKMPNLYRSETGVGKFDVTLVYDGKQGWTIDPWFDVSFPRILNASEENVLLQKAEIGSPFLNYKQKGYLVELVGKESLDGIEMFHLKLTRQNGKVENWYLNANTYLEYKQTSMWDDFGFTTPQETYFDDFREVEGLILPFYIDRSFSIRNRVTEVESVEINPVVDDRFFKMPPSSEMLKLEFMAGEWAVVVKAPGRHGWQQVDSVSTSIEFIDNQLFTKLSYENYVRYNKAFSWSYNTESKSYRMTVYSSFSSNLHVLEGQFENDTLAFSSSDVNFANSENKVYRKFEITNRQDNEFLLELAQSQDKGISWQTNERLYFTRIE